MMPKKVGALDTTTIGKGSALEKAALIVQTLKIECSPAIFSLPDLFFEMAAFQEHVIIIDLTENLKEFLSDRISFFCTFDEGIVRPG